VLTKDCSDSTNLLMVTEKILLKINCEGKIYIRLSDDLGKYNIFAQNRKE